MSSSSGHYSSERTTLKEETDDEVTKDDKPQESRNRQKDGESQGENQGLLQISGRLLLSSGGHRGENGRGYRHPDQADGQMDEAKGVVEVRDRPLDEK